MFESLISGIVQAVSEIIWMLWLWIEIMCVLIGAIIGKFVGDLFFKKYPSEFIWITVLVFAYLGYKSALLVSVAVPLTVVGVILLAIFTPVGAILGALLTGMSEIAGTAGKVYVVESVRRKIQ